MTKIRQNKFSNDLEDQTCGKSYDKEDITVRDHWHVTEKIQRFARQFCKAVWLIDWEAKYCHIS